MLDIDFGTYPFVTSSSTGAGGVCTGLGVPPAAVETTIGVMKAYTTRVGGGPFPTECLDKVGEHMQTVGHEYGATTGRKRRCGWLDLNIVKYSNALNGFKSLNLTKLDVLTGLDEIKVATHYSLGDRIYDGSFPASLDDLAKCEVHYETFAGWGEDISKASSFEELPANAQKYVTKVEELVGLPLTWIGIAPEREGMIRRHQT